MMTSPADTDRLLQQLLAASPHERAALLKSSVDDDNPSELLRALAELSEDWAISDLERATAAARMLADLSDRTGSPSARARARRAVAQTIAYDNRFEEALALLHEAQTLAARSGDHLEAACAAVTTLHPLARLGRLEEAAREGGAAREVLLKLGKRDLAARADINLGVIHRMRDDPEAAIVCFRRAEPLIADAPLVAAQLKSNLAEALLDLHRFQEAEDVFREALLLFESQGAGRASAIVAGNIADLLSRQGRFGPAMLLFEQARAALEAEDADHAAGDAARLQAEQAETLAAAGAHKPAVTAYTRAIPVLLSRSLAADAARAQAGLGKALLALRQYAPAIRALDAAVESFTSLSHQTAADRARITRALAVAAGGDEFDAQRTLAELIERLADRPADSCTARLALANLLVDDGRTAEASPIIDLAVQQARQLSLSPLLADALHARARLALQTGDVAAAQRDLKEAVEQIERSRGALQADRLRVAFFAERHRVYEDAFDVALRSDLPDRDATAFDIAERAKSRGLLDLLRAEAAAEAPRNARGDTMLWHVDPVQQRLAQERRVLNALYAEWEDARTRPENAEQRAEWRARLADCEQTISLLESRLAADQPGADLFAAPARLEDLARSIPDDAAVLEYYFSNGRIACFVIRRHDTRIHLLPATVADIDEAVNRLHFHIRRAIARSDVGQGMPAADQLQRELRGLHDMLLAPLRADLAGASHLWVIPHGSLHAVPFHALSDGDAYLLNSNTISTAPSATVLTHVLRTAESSVRDERKMLVIGLSDADIPYAEDEAETIASLLPGAQRLIGRHATIDAFTHAASQASVIHIATHARFAASDPLASGLKLADGWITAREIASLRLTGATVTLSACESGRSGVDAGGELLGLLRAFLVAGATSLIASHWPVSDAIAREVMADAYLQWHNSGEKPLVRCLRRSVLDAAARRPHPAEWAPFFTVGV